MEHTVENAAYTIVRDIVCEKVSPERITRSGAKTYLAIQLDSKPHKTICRLYLDGKVKYIGTMNHRKVETRTRIHSLDDIVHFSRLLTDIVKYYESQG